MRRRARAPRHRDRQSSGHLRDRQSGYNMVVLMVLVTVLHVLVAAALPSWSGAIQREKEEELIFRGLQYAEAIRVFQARFGRPPSRLEELVEVEPRSIRRLWEDPMTGEARWGLIFAGGGAPIPGQGQGGDGGLGTDATQPPPTITSGDRDQVTQGPISGVHSLARGEAMLEFQGKQRYSEWLFTVDVVSQGMQQRQVVGIGPGEVQFASGAVSSSGVGSTIPDLSSRWIGRPWPPALEQSLDQNLQQGGMPGDAAARPIGGGPAGGQPNRR
jgi:type II secretory pathway pseudopilin PulG